VREVFPQLSRLDTRGPRQRFATDRLDFVHLQAMEAPEVQR
jgi:hypothetical protein